MQQGRCVCPPHLNPLPRRGRGEIKGRIDQVGSAISCATLIKPELPPAWRWVRLGGVIREARLGFASGKRDLGGVVQLRMNNVTNRGRLEWSSFIRVPADPETIATYQLEPGDVLFNNTNSTDLVGKTALFEGHSEPVVFSNHFTRLRVIPDKVSPSFLAFWLQEQWQQRVFENICNRWIGQSAVQRDKLLSLGIPLPPLEEQRRIAAILNEQMAAVQRARAAAESQLAAAKSLPSAYLRTVFNSPEAQEWQRKRLREVCEVVTGSTPPRGESRFYGGTIPWVKPDDLDRSIYVDSSYEYLSDEGGRAARILPAGSVLVSCIGKLGKSAIAARPLATNQQINSLIPKAEVDSVYLYFACEILKPELEARASSTIVPIVNKSAFSGLEIPLPPLAEQQRVATILTEQKAAAEKTRIVLEAQLAAINALPVALLRRAFSGEL